MAKRIVCTIKISIDTKDPSQYKLELSGNGSMPAEDLGELLTFSGEHFSKTGGNIGDHFKEK